MQEKDLLQLVERDTVLLLLTVINKVQEQTALKLKMKMVAVL